jgi:predicted nucleic acid-binding protein
MVSIQICRDAKDDKFLELAISGKADCIISGDDDLLSIKSFQGIPIVSPRQFVDETNG